MKSIIRRVIVNGVTIFISRHISEFLSNSSLKHEKALIFAFP
jgi:hypothetical protein